MYFFLLLFFLSFCLFSLFLSIFFYFFHSYVFFCLFMYFFLSFSFFPSLFLPYFFFLSSLPSFFLYVFLSFFMNLYLLFSFLSFPLSLFLSPSLSFWDVHRDSAKSVSLLLTHLWLHIVSWPSDDPQPSWIIHEIRQQISPINMQHSLRCFNCHLIVMNMWIKKMAGDPYSPSMIWTFSPLFSPTDLCVV